MELLHTGKIRDVYADGDDVLLVASDKVSVYDVVPNHVVSATDVPPEWAGRAVRCRRLEIVQIECIARGYLAGLGLDSYRTTGTISGIPLPPGLAEGSKLPEPVFTPSTKATVGHDEFITADDVAAQLGAHLAAELRRITLEIYQRGAELAAKRGVIIADTKLEFGLTPGGELVLADELLTSDSSRFWSADDWQPGRPQRYLDKQFVRDWSSTVSDWDRTPPGPPIPDDIVEATRARYIEVYERITQTRWQEV